MHHSSRHCKSIQELLRSLEDSDPIIRHESATQLGFLLPQSDDVILALGNAINDGDPEVAQSAGIALFFYGLKCKIIIQQVTQALKHSDVAVRRVAAGILYLIGPEAISAVPILESMKNADDQALRGWVVQALNKIMPISDSNTLNSLDPLLLGPPESDESRPIQVDFNKKEQGET